MISDAGGVGGTNVLHDTAAEYADATARALLAGLDVIFQGGLESAPLLQAAFERGLVPDEVVDSAVAREAAVTSAVLLQNRAGLLPLGPELLRTVAVIGTDAVEGRLGGYSGPGRRVVTILDGLRVRLGASRVRFEPGPGRLAVPFATVPAASLRPPQGRGRGLHAACFSNPALDGEPAVERVDSAVDFHWTFLPPAETLDKRWYSVRWTGALVAPVTGRMQLGVEGNDGFRLYLNEQLVIDAWEKRGFSSRQTSIAAVRGRAYQLRLEFRDRASLAPPGQQEELIRRVAATGRPVVVVLIGGGAVTMTGWLDQVAAVGLSGILVRPAERRWRRCCWETPHREAGCRTPCPGRWASCPWSTITSPPAGVTTSPT